MRMIIMRQKYSKQYFKVNGSIMTMGDVLMYYPCEACTVEALETLTDGETLELRDYIPLIVITPYNAA